MSAHGNGNRKTLLDGFGEATEKVIALRSENERLQKQVAAMGATLQDFADPDHWTQNDEGQWVWYGYYPPFERPAIDLLGTLGANNSKQS